MLTSQAAITIHSPRDLGAIARSKRQHLGRSLRQTSASTHLGVRFLSEFERGKPTAEIGKIIEALNAAGLDLAVVPRSYAVDEPTDLQRANRLSQQLNLESPYDWPNAQMDNATFIRQVLRKGRFNDVLRIVGHFGLTQVESELAFFEGTPEAPYLVKVLGHIRLGMEEANA